jgi:hypothetical protein
LISDRAKLQGVSLEDPKFFPESLAKLIHNQDPAAMTYRVTDSQRNPFIGRRIFVMSGADDRLVPWSASKGFVDALDVGEQGIKRVFLQEGAGHECTSEMVVEMTKFIHEQLRPANKL